MSLANDEDVGRREAMAWSVTHIARSLEAAELAAYEVALSLARTRRAADVESACGHLDQMLAAQHRAGLVVSRARSFAERVGTGRFDIRPVRIGDVFERALASSQAASQPATYVARSQPEDLEVFADELVLEAIIAALLRAVREVLRRVRTADGAVRVDLAASNFSERAAVIRVSCEAAPLRGSPGDPPERAPALSFACWALSRLGTAVRIERWERHWGVSFVLPSETQPLTASTPEASADVGLPDHSGAERSSREDNPTEPCRVVP